MLADKIEHYKITKTMLYNTPAQYKNEFPWLKEVDCFALCNAQLNLQKAFCNFFRNPSKVGFPKFKSKKTNKYSYTTNRVGENIKITNGALRLPKVGFVKTKLHREIPTDYRIKSVTLSITPDGKYYASILTEYDDVVCNNNGNTVIGLDYSMNELYVDSNGNEPAYPKYYRNTETKLAREQRKLSLMEKGSNNRNKQRTKLAKIHRKVANQRKDFLHKESRKIANSYDCVCIEDLNMKEMAQIFNFGKSVYDNGWGIFTTFLKYKLEDAGKKLIKVDKFFASSQICSECGYKNPITKDLSVREWICPNCGAVHNRDINAAINIKNEGLRLLVA